jgi:hypothetical protein
MRQRFRQPGHLAVLLNQIHDITTQGSSIGWMLIQPIEQEIELVRDLAEIVIFA